jgi:sec-independent protein translocase protein TatB
VFLFILESIGTTELLLIGIVALIFLGPRKLPEMARKIGKLMAEFRGTASEFKETWRREVDFEEEAKAFDLNTLEAEAEPVARVEPTQAASAPTIKEIDPATLEHLVPAGKENTTPAKEPVSLGNPEDKVDDAVDDAVGDKKNWL